MTALLPWLWAACTGIATASVLATATRHPTAPIAFTRMATSPAPENLPARCDSCHSFDPSFSHPVGVRPQASIPDAFPLNDGRLTCTTCHLSTEHDRAGAGPMLRPIIRPGSFCTQCHTSLGNQADAHAFGFERAHLPADNTPDQAAPRARPGRLDAESVACMGCHDGSYAPDMGSHTLGRDHASRADRGHPIGVPYNAMRPRSDDIQLVAPIRLDPRVRLFDQAVGCGSCHSIYAGRDHLLVMSNLRSKLCLACHVE